VQVSGVLVEELLERREGGGSVHWEVNAGRRENVRRDASGYGPA
jgi:hypothetical protein